MVRLIALYIRTESSFSPFDLAFFSAKLCISIIALLLREMHEMMKDENLFSRTTIIVGLSIAQQENNNTSSHRRMFSDINSLNNIFVG
jgi:hypothetical protein